MGEERARSSNVETVIRALSTAHKSLRLYPASSPLPLQSAESAVRALESFFADGEPLLSLAVDRESFAAFGEPVSHNMLGVGDLVEDLRTHGIAEFDVFPSCTPEELLEFLAAISSDPGDAHQGGVAARLVASGVESIRVADVKLTVLEHIGPEPDEDIDEFLRALASDPAKLAAWFAAAAAGDRRTFADGLMELVRVSGPSGYSAMISALSIAFLDQQQEARDVLLGLAIESGPTRDLTGSVFSLLASQDIASSVLGGAFGRNMLSLSTALTKLPLEQTTAQVRADVRSLLPSTGHSEKEAHFLEHMIEVRERTEPERPLAERDATYRAVAAAADLDDTVVEQGLRAVSAARGTTSAVGVRTMLSLLDQHEDAALFRASIDSLANMVPVLVEEEQLELARDVMVELSRRQSIGTESATPESEWLRTALEAASGHRTMSALLAAVEADGSLAGVAAEIVRHGGDTASDVLVAAAVPLKRPGLELAEKIVGRRFGDLLAARAVQLQWFELAPVAHWLAADGGPRSVQALETLIRRRDEQSRREVAQGIADVATFASARILACALRDPSPEVAIVAARAIGRSGSPRAVELLNNRLTEIDLDNADFLLGRELIAALTACEDPAASEALAHLANRKSLIKRGHFAEVQTLAYQALEKRAEAGRVR